MTNNSAIEKLIEKRERLIDSEWYLVPEFIDDLTSLRTSSPEGDVDAIMDEIHELHTWWKKYYQIREILTKHLCEQKDGKWMLRPWEYMKDEFWNIITYEDEQKEEKLKRAKK